MLETLLVALLAGVGVVAVAASRKSLKKVAQKPVIISVPGVNSFRQPPSLEQLQRYANLLATMVAVPPHKPFEVTSEKIPIVYTEGRTDENAVEGYAYSEWDTGDAPFMYTLPFFNFLNPEDHDENACQRRWVTSGDPFWCCSTNGGVVREVDTEKINPDVTPNLCELWNMPLGLDPALRAAKIAEGNRNGYWQIRVANALAQSSSETIEDALARAQPIVLDMVERFAAGPPDELEQVLISELMHELGAGFLGGEGNQIRELFARELETTIVALQERQQFTLLPSQQQVTIGAKS